MLPEVLFLAAAQERFRDQQLSQARDLCQRGIEVYPESGRLWELVGVVAWFQGDTAPCLHALERASMLVPLQPLAQLALASAYALVDKPDLARTVYSHLATAPEFPVPLLPQLAAGLGRLRENAAALLVCERLIDLRPTYHPAWFGVAFYRQRLGEPIENVLAPLEQAHRLAPNARTYRLNLAACLARLNRFAEAFSFIDEIPIAEIPHASWIRQMRPIFVSLGDLARVWECDERLQALEQDEKPHGGSCDGHCPRCLDD